jgi:hypothetical protein
MLVTLTPRLRVHRDEIIYAELRGNAVLLRFVCLKPKRIPVDELTAEARRWLLPSMAPRTIEVADEEEVEEAEAQPEEVDEERTAPGRFWARTKKDDGNRPA